MSKRVTSIDNDEQDILNDFENGEFVSVEGSEQIMKLAKQAASNYIVRDNRVNVRISGADLNMIKKTAVEEGLPYQTLLSSIIHKFVSGRLVDKEKYA